MKDTAIKIPSDKPLFIINEDNDHYFKLPSERMNEKDLVDFVDDIMSGGHVTHIFFCPFGQRPSYASEVCEPIWAGMEDPDMNGKTHNIWCVNAKLLHDKGIDPYKVWLKRTREKGVSPWLSMRMNDVHWVTKGQLAPFENYFRSCNFWREHPELRRNWKATPPLGWEALAFDYSKEPVREFHFNVFKELVDRYAPDGVELDWMRFTRHLSYGHEREQAHILTDFIRQCREYTNEAAKCCGHPVSLSVRVPPLPETAFCLGMDPEVWAAEGLVDLIVVTNSFLTNDYTIPMEEWTKIIGNANPDVLVIPCATNRISSSVTLPNLEMGLEYYYAWGSLMYSRGAKGIYLFNEEYLVKETRDVIHGKGLTPQRLACERKRFPVTYHDCYARPDMMEEKFPCPLSQDNIFGLALSDVRKDSKITVVLGFKEDGTSLSEKAVTLNGIHPCAPAVACENPAQFGDSACKAAMAYTFPSFAARNGMNHVRTKGQKDSDSTLVWCEVVVD